MFDLKFTPHEYQSDFLADALAFARDAQPGDRRLYASPTGTGKSVMELMLLRELPGWVLTTPRVEIIRGFLDKLNHPAAMARETTAIDAALEYGITTPIRLRNRLAAGTFGWRPKGWIIDEVHHSEADSYKDIRAYLGEVPRIGLTATPYRGTPKSTAAFNADWGDEVSWILTLRQAADRGALSIPTAKVLPLVDDDLIEVSNGEIQATAAGKAVTSRISDLVEHCRQFIHYAGTGGLRFFGDDETVPPTWDRPTMFALPNTDSTVDLCDKLNAAGLPAVLVVQGTTPADRQEAFRKVIACEAALVQIAVVSEGVDLPIRRLIDCRPTLSPVFWLQLVGRITRPTDRPPEYICTNRNLARHCYLMEGLIPPAVVAEAQAAFGGPSKRDGARAIGLEEIGKFKAVELPLADGTTGQMYNLTTVDNFHRVDYAVLLHPCSSEPLIACRASAKNVDGTLSWGKWQRADGLPDLTGFASESAKQMSDKQKAWWSRSARGFGLDSTAKVTRKNFAALPILADLRCRLAAG